MSRQIRVYGASKLDHAEFWKKLRVEWPEVHFTARWPFFIGQVDDSAYNARQFWQDDFADVTRADVVMIYAPTQEEKLRGALVEAGMCIALNKTVIVIGEHPDFSTWQYHPNVKRVLELEGARNTLTILARNLT